MRKLINEEVAIECNIPVLNAFDSIITSHQENIKIKCRNPYVRLIKDDFEYLVTANEPFLTMNKLNCCYIPYVQMRRDLSNHEFINYCERIDKKTKVLHEFVKVQCNYGEHIVYNDYIDFALSKLKFPPLKSNSNHLNVIVFLLNGVSRMAMHRHLPETKKYLETLKAIEFTKFMRIDEDAFSNVMALLTGLQKADYYLCWTDDNDTTFDNCPFVWRTFSSQQFLTAFVEDAGHADIFNHNKNGFSVQPVDYYWRPFNMLLDEIKLDPQNMKTSNVKQCAGDMPLYTRFFRYSKKFFKRMLKDRQKFFAFFRSTTVSNEDNILLASVDEDLRNFFVELHQDGVLTKTAMFFLSDHGARYGNIRNTHQGSFEMNLPFMFAYLPAHFKNKYVSLYSNFELNKDKLTTMFDIHETLNDIATSKFGSNNYSFSKGTSLFRKIPSTRNCKDAGIPLTCCACAQTYIPIRDHMLKFVVGQVIVNRINEFVRSQADCANLNLNKVLDARYIKYWSQNTHLYQLKVTISTRPGSGMYEAILKQVKDKYVVIGPVKRLSPFGKEGHCVKNTTLKLYCVC
ncbi:hypothetical protein MML48_4g00014800 [Holotrichia oblita]|uniref:Uncharacterized protein n=1 Tax=Holotrichia oblita TaxID=644536 RepID=A0ACB9T9N6_HOLOL|nr:hypothetical protein MML48_4g00014800 [Holotrichia oblita]